MMRPKILQAEAPTITTEEAVIVECDLAEPPEQVWRALTEPELLAAWLMPNDIDPEIGARFAFDAAPELGGDLIDCEILAAEPHRLLRYSWHDRNDAEGGELDSIVTFELTENPRGGTHLRLVHSGFPLRLDRPIAQLIGAGRAMTGMLMMASPMPLKLAA